MLAWWGQITNPTKIAITAAATATVNRLHEVSGTSSDYDITMPASPATGDVCGFYVREWANTGGRVADKQYRLDFGSGKIIASRSRYLTLLHGNVALFVYDGTNWQPLVLCLDTIWVDGGDFAITAVTTNPTLGTNTRNQLWRRSGDSCEQWNKYTQIAAGASGTGEYLIPTVFTVRTGMPVNTASSVNSSGDSIIGHGGIGYNATQFAECSAHLYNLTQFRVSIINDGNRAWFGSGQAPLSLSSVLFTFQTRYPVQYW
jgi:hypothetical protein